MNEYISCDYRYDAHDRLIGADYTPAATDSVGEDFSTSYSYDAIGRPLTLRRYGVIGIDGKGRVEQHTGDYPCGEPWREPAGQPYLFGGKERRRFASLGDSDFHARFLTTATGLWQAPDVHAGKYPWLSPWVFCNANPIKYLQSPLLAPMIIR